MKTSESPVKLFHHSPINHSCGEFRKFPTLVFIMRSVFLGFLEFPWFLSFLPGLFQVFPSDLVVPVPVVHFVLIVAEEVVVVVRLVHDLKKEV